MNRAMAAAVFAVVIGMASATPATSMQPRSTASAVDTTLTLATYNICKKTCGTGEFAWANRKSAVLRTLAASYADVIGIQEASGTVTELMPTLAAKGYLRAASWTFCRAGCTADSYIFYKADTIEPVPYGVEQQTNAIRYSSAGMGSETLKSLTSGLNWSGSFDRNFAYAVLRHKGTGAAFIASSVHLPTEKTPAAERLRRASAGAIAARLDAITYSLGAGDIPRVLLGDLNSFPRRQPKGAQHVLSRLGFKDALKAPVKVNSEVPTVNTTNASRDPFPMKPFRFRDPARIDYVMFDQGRPLRYELFLRLKKGKFDNRYRGSDHNMVIARVAIPTVPIPDPVPVEPGRMRVNFYSDRTVLEWDPPEKPERAPVYVLKLRDKRMCLQVTEPRCVIRGAPSPSDLYEFSVRDNRSSWTASGDFYAPARLGAG